MRHNIMKFLNFLININVRITHFSFDLIVYFLIRCPETQRYLKTQEMREDGKTDAEIEEYFAKVAVAPNYEDVLDEIKEEDIPREKVQKPPHVFFLSWFVPWYQSVEQIPSEFKA